MLPRPSQRSLWSRSTEWNTRWNTPFLRNQKFPKCMCIAKPARLILPWHTVGCMIVLSMWLAPSTRKKLMRWIVSRRLRPYFVFLLVFIYAFIEEKELSWKSGHLWVTNIFVLEIVLEIDFYCSWNCNENLEISFLESWNASLEVGSSDMELKINLLHIFWIAHHLYTMFLCSQEDANNNTP